MAQVVHRSVFLRRVHLDMVTGKMRYTIDGMHGRVSDIQMRIAIQEQQISRGIFQIVSRYDNNRKHCADSSSIDLAFQCVEPGVCAARIASLDGQDLRHYQPYLELAVLRDARDAPFFVPSVELEYTLDTLVEPPASQSDVEACLDVD